MSQPNLLRSVIAQAIHGEKSVVSRRNFSSLRSKYDEREMFAKTNRRRLLAFLVATSLSFHLWEFTKKKNARREEKNEAKKVQQVDLEELNKKRLCLMQ
ncbi:hypothetical protein AtNW77_Chr3g0167471 [Arabidopsis thaliana]